MLPATPGAARCSQNITEPAPIERAGRDHAVVDDHPSAPPRRRAADELPSAGEPVEQRLCALAAHVVELGGIEVRQAHLDPAPRVRRSTDAQAVAVADVTNRPGEGPARHGRQRSLAGVGARGRR